MREADIVVNGRVLSFAECLAVRVAVTSFRVTLADPEYRDGLGERLAAGYDHHLAQVEHTMLLLAGRK